MFANSRLLSVSTAVLLILMAVAHAADTQAIAQFDLPAQPLGDSLRAVARQTNTNVLFDRALVNGRIAPALKGEATVDGALTQLLAGSGLRHQFVDEKTVTLMRAGDTRATQLPSTNAAAGDGEERPLLLAGAQQESATRGNQTPSQSEKSDSQLQPRRQENQIELGEVVVTGTHIRGVQIPGSNLIVIDRDYVDQSGYATVQDIVRTLPQNFAGGVNEILGTTDFGVANVNYGSAVNLRGLGASATLVLVNGHRTVSGGFAGAFVDVSNIPSSAIERIEVLTDGASAVYGSDAVGGVVNLILRDDYDGAETRARFGTLDGDADEIQASQLFGKDWDGGNVLLGYQYYERDTLLLTDRPYSADTDQRPQGGDNFSSSNSNPGNIFDLSGQPAFAIPTGQDGTALAVGDLLPGVVNFQNQAEQNALLPKQEMHSVFLDLSQEVGERVRLFVEGRYNVREVISLGGGTGQTLFVPDTNPFFVDPFGFGFVLLGYNFLDDLGPSVSSGESESYGGLLGATFDLGETWQLTLTGSYAEEKNGNEIPGIDFTALDQALADPDPTTAFNPFGDGSNTNPATLAAIRTTSRSDAVSDILNGDVIADGPLFALPGGAARLAIGASYREEEFDSRTQEAGIPDTIRGRDRRVSAAFAELALPFVSQDNAMRGIQRLNVSVAGRYDDYSDFGTTFNPKLGLAWNPVEALRVRGTWGTSFKAPRLIELDEGPDTNSAVLLPAADPQSPTGTSFALFVFGNNANLQEETATTWTAGVDLVPAALSGFNLSLTYYDIDYEDRVVRPGPFQLLTILTQEDQWAEVIQRNPSQAEVDAICNSPIYRGTPCNFLPFPSAIVDVRLRNLAATRTSGLDLNISHTIDSRNGVFNLGLNGTYALNFETAASDTSPVIDVVDTLFNPVALRLRGTVSWSRGGLGANAAINFTDSYEDKTSQPNRSIDEWTTLDLQLSYRTRTHGWLNNLEVALNAVNVFDEDPPFANTPTGFDATNANAYGRLISLQATLGW